MGDGDLSKIILLGLLRKAQNLYSFFKTYKNFQRNEQ